MSESSGKRSGNRKWDRPRFPIAEDNALKIEEWQARQRRVSVKMVLGIGAELVEAQQKLAHHGNGTFGEWYKQRLHLSETQVRRYMGVHRRFRDHAKLAESFALSVLYEFAEPGIPQQAFQDALAVAEGGGWIGRQRALVLIEDARKNVSATQPGAAEEGNSYLVGGRPAAGRGKRPSGLERLKSLWERATSDERSAFQRWITVQQLMTKAPVAPEGGMVTYVPQYDRIKPTLAELVEAYELWDSTDGDGDAGMSAVGSSGTRDSDW